MRIHLTICILFFVCVSLTWAETGKEPDLVIEKTYGFEIRKVMPTEFAAFNEKRLSGKGEDSMAQSLDLVMKARRMMGTARGGDEVGMATANAYRSSWCIVLRQARGNANPSFSKQAVDAWNDSLTNGSPQVAYQIQALGREWDEAFLSPAFWTLFDNTSDKAIVSAVCYALFNNGKDEDIERLIAKQRSSEDRRIRGIIQNAINWRKYDKGHEADDVGPAALAPHAEYFGMSNGKDAEGK